MAKSKAKPAPPEELSFEAIAERLEGIAERLEGGDTKLEDALALFEEGVRLAKTGNERLDSAERRIEELLADNKVEPLVGESFGDVGDDSNDDIRF